MVDTQTVEVRVRVRHETSLEDFVWARPDAWDEGRWFECGLLDLGVVVLGVLVEFHLPHFNEREICMRPDLGEIKRVPLMFVGL